MNTALSPDPASDRAAALTIGDLAEATGVSTGTLRMWERRHGFPSAERLPSGHRRYSRAQVAQVLDVVRRSELGTRLDVAIKQVLSAGPEPRSVYAELVRRHPGEPRQQLRKGTLIALSWAIEDEIAASGASGNLFGAFQTSQHFAAARARWRELARVARATYVFADFTDLTEEDAPDPGLTRVHLADDAPMRREWTVVHDSAELPVVLTAWELPGQDGTPDRLRMFESAWSLDPTAVRDAAVCCARIAADSGHAAATELLEGPLGGAPVPAPDPLSVTRLAHRAVAYADARLGARGSDR